tara:strand:- start:591 stop:1016 length:426 start_codon:yes stop_codon:yes gene_type:complete
MIYDSLAYQGCPSTSGKWNHLPDDYQDFQTEMEDKRKAKDDEEKRRNERTWKTFFEGFDPFGEGPYGERELPASFEEINHDDEDGYPFSVFNLKRSASEEDMKIAYRQGILETHPDKSGEDSSDSFRILQEAYEYYKSYLC